VNFILNQIDGFANKTKEDKNQTRISRLFFYVWKKKCKKRGRGAIIYC